MGRVADFPDVLRLRGPDGRVTGLFSDCGAWFGVTWGERAHLELRTFWNERAHALQLTPAPVRARRVWADRLELEHADGAQARVGFASADALVIEHVHAQPPQPATELPFSVARVGERCWRVVVVPEGGAVADADCFERNRRRWDLWFERAFAPHAARAQPADTALARAVATLFWNWRAPRRELAHAGVIPSPFAYLGYWGWDSWKHAHALSRLEPALAAEQLRAMFSRQRRDGMVPDTVMPRASLDNWSNSKPPMAGWALEAVWRHGGDRGLVADLYPRNAAFLAWWRQQRGSGGEPFLRCGGVDRETAAWDSGWDDSVRFAGAELESGVGPWRLFDLWQPDLNAYLLAEYRAMARLAPSAGADPAPWEEQARQLQVLLRERLWDESVGAFVDRRARDGASTGVLSAAAWLPAWAGAASARQQARLAQTLSDPRHFATPLPFPALAASASGFDPDGYWNGAVWLDHAALALHVLGPAGAEPARRLWDAAADGGALYECYSPLSGRPCAGRREAVPQFSWSAAALLEMAAGGPEPAPTG
ncbi:MAG: hypothetical protein EYC70_06960 [Planctomycetota bacterium]|nr:MAG: hypothetical protein EYC70_06960 [Planctomycetota bacterium]